MTHRNVQLEPSWSDYSREIRAAHESVGEADVLRLAAKFAETITRGSRFAFVGNGGSHSIAEHAQCDFLKGLHDSMDDEKQFPINLVNLTSPATTFSAISNDISYDDVFAIQVKYHLSDGDMLILISSSGNSKNILRAAAQAKKGGVHIFALTGFNEPSILKSSDDYIHVKSSNYGIVEDVHMSILHSVSQILRSRILSGELLAKNLP